MEDNIIKKYWVIIAFVTFEGEVFESEIETADPRKEFEDAMLMVYHRQLTFAQAVIMYDIRHEELCRFEVSKTIYGHAHAVSEYQNKLKHGLTPVQHKILKVREEAHVRKQRHAYMVAG